MFKCEYCGKEIKSKGGLTRHMSSCKKTDDKAAINLDIVGTESTYYEGHPRRDIKLRGLLSRTTDEQERIKIIQMLVELDENN